MSQPALLTYDPSVWLLLLSVLCCLSPPHIRGKMSSGLKLSEEAVCLFCEMKVCPKDKPQVRLATFTIQGEKINECRRYTDECLGKDGDPYEVLCDLAKDDNCFYFLYDCHFETKEGHQKEELVFGSWIPDSCKIKDRMTYSSSRCGVKNSFRGVKHNLQLSDRASLCPRSVFAELLEKNTSDIQKMEGKPVRPDLTQQQTM